MAQPFEEYLLLQPPQRVLDITGGLVSMTDGVLRLIHCSVRDFLIRPEERWICEPDRAVQAFRIDITQTHRSFAWLCLDYMRLGKEGRESKPDTSRSAQAVWDSYPLLEYATLYAFHHLNRSGPHCAITLAKMEKLLESDQSVLWVEHFFYLLFEDITLDSQLDEFYFWQDRMADTDLDKRFFAIFEKALNERTGQMRKAGKSDDPLTEHLEMYLNQATDGQFGTLSQKQSNEATDSVLESGTGGPDLQPHLSNSRPSSNDIFATVSKVMDLLKGQTSLHIAHQVEIWLRLSNSLRKTRLLVDPLKVLFQLILRKVSGIPVFALLAIGAFYEKLGKSQEALEVYAAASRKLDHLDVPLKCRIHSHMGDGYWELQLDMEALRAYERAFSGQEILLGTRHSDTLQNLRMMIQINSNNAQHTEVLRLSDKICTEQESVPEWNLEGNLELHRWRYTAYHCVGDYDRAADMRQLLQVTLKTCRESYSNDDGTHPPNLLFQLGAVYDVLGEYDTALESFQLAFEAYKKSTGPNSVDTLQTQHWIAATYVLLGRFYEAKELYKMLNVNFPSVFGPDHRQTRFSKQESDALRFELGELDDDEVHDANRSRIVI